MPLRQRSGSVVCRSCGRLVGVRDERCYECGAWNPGLWGFAPVVRRLGSDFGFVRLLIGGCVVLYVIGLLFSRRALSIESGPFNLLSPDPFVLLWMGASGALPVFGLGRWWTVLSAAWLHAGLLHILFNMLWVRQLAPAVAELYGAGRLVIIYTVAAICGFTLSTVAGVLFPVSPIPLLPFLAGGRFTVGASAPIFGLLGAIVWYGRRGGSHLATGQAATYAIVLFVMGFIMPGVDNYAHAGGFAGGWVMARVLDPLKPERLNHLVWALVCLALSVASIAASLLHPLGFGRG